LPSLERYFLNQTLFEALAPTGSIKEMPMGDKTKSAWDRACRVLFC